MRGRKILRNLSVAGLVLAAARPAVAAVDLSVAWIERLPKIDSVWNSSNPTVEGWPAPGQRVQWVAHVRNLSDRRLSHVSYRWLLDGKVVREGSRTLRPNGITKLKLPWIWERARHELVFEIDPDGAIAEREERNNRLLVYTDALAVGFWVERTFWNTVGETVSRAGIGATTVEDWLQKRIQQYNEMAALAVYPETPKGVLDRWRIDAIHLVRDGALPLHAPGPEVRDWGAPLTSYPILYPDTEDRTIDLQWGFPGYTAAWYVDYDAWPLMYDSLIHELGHARYLIDVYSWNVSSDNDQIGILPGPLPNQFGVYHFTPEQGLMNTSWGYIDRYSATALNLIAGQRAIEGTYNEPANIGSFLNDLPARNRVRLVSPSGAIFPHHQVRLYRASDAPDPDWLDHVLRLTIDGQPDAELETDSQGAVDLGRNPFSDGPVVDLDDRNNALAILEVVDGNASHWGYLESRALNLAYWRGDVDQADYDLVVDAPQCAGPGIGPDRVVPYHWSQVAPGEVTFAWQSQGAFQEFELWYSVDGHRPKHVEATADVHGGQVSTTIPLQGRRVAWWLVYRQPFNPAECPAVRSSIFFFDLESAGRP
jgi:hypothetical protein